MRIVGRILLFVVVMFVAWVAAEIAIRLLGIEDDGIQSLVCTLFGAVAWLIALDALDRSRG